MNIRRFSPAPLFILASLILLPQLSQAHLTSGEHAGFASGFNHPIHGLDHILAMVAVGLWASQLGGRSLWAVPATFVGIMLCGGAMGMVAWPLPFVEQGILASVFILGLLITASIRANLPWAMLITGLFALFHGHAHGAEMPLTGNGFLYGFGFAIATAVLHAGGIAVGLLLGRFTQPVFVRFAGACVLAIGAWMVFAG